MSHPVACHQRLCRRWQGVVLRALLPAVHFPGLRVPLELTRPALGHVLQPTQCPLPLLLFLLRFRLARDFHQEPSIVISHSRLLDDRCSLYATNN